MTAKFVEGECISEGTPATVNPQPVTPLAPEATVTQPTCDIETGTITVTAIDGVTYSINGIDYQESNIFTEVEPGTYNVTVQSEAGCVSAGTSVTVNPQPETPVAPIAEVTQPTCEVATGTITVTPIEGVTYSIDGQTYQPSNVFAGVAPGTYTVTVQSGAGCISTGTPVTVNPQPVTPTAPQSGGDQVACSLEEVVLTATASAGEGFEVVWYDAPSGGSVVEDPSLSEEGSITYYAAAVNEAAGCESAERTPVTLTINRCTIEIEKTADKSTISGIGEVITYTLTVTNTGDASLTNVTVTDPLTGFEETVDVLEAGESVSFETEYTVTQEDLDKEGVLNVATVTAQTPSEEEIGDEDEVSVGVGANEIIANDDDFGSYFLSYGGLIGNILDNDLLKGERPDPADVDFEFTELDGIIGLLINDNGELSLIPQVNEIRDYTLRYVLREVVNPSNNDDALVFFRILNDQADLRITKEALQEEVFEGDLFDYELVVSNVGETDATNVVVTDNIPAGVTYQSYTVTSNTSGSTVTATVSGNNVSFAIPFLGAGESVTIQIRVKAGAAGRVVNTAIVGSDQDELTPDDNEDSDETEIEPFRIPNVITPNGDGRNDVFEIQGLGKYASNSITIFNRYGDHVLERANYGNDWDAPGQVAGTYFYVLRVTSAQGDTTEFKGWIQVIKE
ncbi:T9SS type B sorting domain-containing protein [Algoriphagus boritolerans]|uniref:T9SS type B sorting domain-containing protein n=1 Tax=Algoriphagus boritolerans TaxID=308111 RepID=UPI001358F8FA|nr:gliding motility-associated C-terminal domain-containing protein [Algoriphagus boritolerans]